MRFLTPFSRWFFLLFQSCPLFQSTVFHTKIRGLIFLVFSCIITACTVVFTSYLRANSSKGVIDLVTKTRRSTSRAHIRRWLCMLCATLMLFGAMTVGTSAASYGLPAASTPTKVYLDGYEVLDGDCVIWRNTTYVPLRKFCNLFDECSFSWNSSKATATVYTKSGMTLIIRSGALYIYANGHY